MDKKISFINNFLIKYPNFEILEFTGIANPMVVKSPEGIIYKKNYAFRFLSHNLSVQSVLDKEGYIQDQLDKLKFPLKLLNYQGMKEKVTVQDENGFTYSPQCYDLLRGHPVTIQTCNEKEDLFMFKANLKHNFRYEYKKFVYTNGKQKIPIVCREHGEFKTTVEGHLFGSGCPTCKQHSAGFSKTKWVNKFKNKSCIFYILEFYNNKESFIKVGITSRTIKFRYQAKSEYFYKTLFEIVGNSNEVCNLENEFLTKYKEYKFYPLSQFVGKTECFSIKIKNLIYEQFKN